MDNSTYFQLKRNLHPKKWKADIVKWRKANPERVRKTTRLRVARFRARNK